MVARLLPGWAVMTTGRPVFLVGVIAYVLSWFLPVLPFYSFSGGGDGYVWGWEAFLFAMVRSTDFCATALSTLSALTNLLMLGAVFIMLKRRAPPPKAVTISLVVAAIFNTYWFFLGGPAWAFDMIPDTFRNNCNALHGGFTPLLAGYYVWLTSFVLVAIASHFHRGCHESTSP